MIPRSRPPCPAIPAYLGSDDIRPFPATECALTEPNGLLAYGGALTPRSLLAAYSQGIFPWFNAQDPILWWSPAPRVVIYPDQFQPTRSLRKTLRQQRFQLTFDESFIEVMEGCSQPRAYTRETWISPAMKLAYHDLHQAGYAHSVECWQADHLVGGLYGIALGSIFFGESMFSRVSDASKVAFATLVEQLKAWQFTLIDCQVGSPHIYSLGAIDISRATFNHHLHHDLTDLDRHRGHWRAPSPDPTAGAAHGHH